MTDVTTIVHECDAKWGRKAYIELRGDTVVFDDSMEEYGPVEFELSKLIAALEDHRNKTKDKLASGDMTSTYNRIKPLP